jgi:hypothetical protein
VRPIFFSAAAASLLVRSSMRARTTELPGMALVSLGYIVAQGEKCRPADWSRVRSAASQGWSVKLVAIRYTRTFHASANFSGH